MSKSSPSTELGAVKEFLALTAALAEINGDVPCRDNNDWFADDHKVRAVAADRCWDCPLITTCAAYADTAHEKWGVWAGIDRQLARNRKATAA